MSKSSWKLKIEEIAERDRMEKENTNDWKDLDIGNIPSDFKDNDNYLLRVKNLGDNWINDEITDKEDRTRVLHYVIDGNFDYQYKLKPLEPIRITEDLKDFIMSKLVAGKGELKTWNGRKVEIID